MFSARISHTDNESILELSGRFDFSSYAGFKKHQEELLNSSTSSKTIVVDMRNLEYLDSAALGILLLMREKAENKKQSMVLKGAKGIVRDILQVAHFQKLFRFVD